MVDKLSVTAAAPPASAPAAGQSATSAAAAWLHRYGGNAFTGVTGGKDAGISRTASPAASGTATPNRPAPPHTYTPVAAETFNQADGMISLDVIENFLQLHAEAMGRVVELSVAGET